MVIFLITGCGSTGEVTEPQDFQEETTSELLNEVEQDDEDLNSTDAIRNELEERQLSVAERSMENRFQREANDLTHLYITAQQLFYNGYSEQALILIQQANGIRDNADIRALKGSIYLSLGNREKFEENWKKAFELDTEVPIPSVPIIERELQNLGLIK